MATVALDSKNESNKPKLTHNQERRKAFKLKKKNSKLIKNATAMNSVKDAETEKKLLEIAGEMWRKLMEIVKANKEFVDLDDKKKLDYFRDTLKYSEFMTEFPIVSRYMIVMGQYSGKAFTRMLNKMKTVKHPSVEEREKGYMEDQWIRRQADYVRFLWEAYQKRHYSTTEAGYIWEDAYTKLKGEFDDFRNKYKEVEEKTKEEKEQFKAANARDLLERLKTGEQKISNVEMINLMFVLKNKVYRRRFSNVLEEMLKKRPEILPSAEGVGCGPEDQDVLNKGKPTMRMIEHVDEKRIGEIPKELLLDDETARQLPGYLDGQ